MRLKQKILSMGLAVSMLLSGFFISAFILTNAITVSASVDRTYVTSKKQAAKSEKTKKSKKTGRTKKKTKNKSTRNKKGAIILSKVNSGNWLSTISSEIDRIYLSGEAVKKAFKDYAESDKWAVQYEFVGGHPIVMSYIYDAKVKVLSCTVKFNGGKSKQDDKDYISVAGRFKYDVVAKRFIKNSVKMYGNVSQFKNSGIKKSKYMSEQDLIKYVLKGTKSFESTDSFSILNSVTKIDLGFVNKTYDCYVNDFGFNIENEAFSFTLSFGNNTTGLTYYANYHSNAGGCELLLQH